MGSLSRPRLAVAVNPSANKGSGDAVGTRVVEALRATGRRVDELRADSYVELERLAREAVAHGIDALIVVGGDGTVQLGTNVCADTTTPLAVVPCGTGNDTAEGILHMPVGNAEAAIARIIAALDRPVWHIDAGRVRWKGGERLFCSTVSAGFDALVNERVNRLRFPRGASRYTVGMLVELFRLAPLTYRLTLDGTTTEESAILTTIANNSQYGGGMKICPEALPDDGVFDLLMVRPLPRRQFIGIYPRVFKGTHVTDPRVVIRRGNRFTLDSPGLVAYSDGERLGPLPIDVEVLPHALAVLDTRF